ncbi:MAG TPA: ABC transporter permease subunit [Verrucomicrobiae bacterium]|nr:ABC transporter permease subunit [Verrucomicrobiae bacterium]
MNETVAQTRSSGYYRFVEFCRRVWVYVLLVVGTIIFAWPFLWMATTSVKVDREMFVEQMHVWPQRPIPQIKSPYIDTRYYEDLAGKHLEELLPVLETHLQKTDYPWPPEIDRAVAIKQVARGAFQKLQTTMPVTIWDSNALVAEATQRVDAAMVTDVLGQIRRALLIGQLRARSYDLQEDQLIAPDKVSAGWQVGGTGEAKLVQVEDKNEPHAELRYDFTHGDKVTLSQTFQTSYPIARLYRLQLYLRNDDTWHPLTVYIEKLGKRYQAEQTYDLADFTSWSVGTWQEPGPDDKTNKIRTWKLLREIGPSPVTGPNEIKVTIEIDRNTQAGAWGSKMLRNYKLALQHMPFWRYMATSLFIVILNVCGTLLSSSLVAYSFARLQWPGRNFCFALMLGTMMVPMQVTMIPLFLIVRALGWYNTLYPLWIISFFGGAFNVFLLRQFLRGIPRDLEDASKIDGCGFWRVYWHIMLPLVKPTLAAISIFTFMASWNEFMAPLIYLQDQRLYPLALGLFAFNVEAGITTSMLMAASLLMILPVIIIFFFAQKYFIQGVTLTGMKG